MQDKPDDAVFSLNWKTDLDLQRATVVLMLIGACWFAAWPYMGLWHDARLYALEALARLNPGVFDRDLFLMYGSQGKFTLFPGMFTALIDRIGLEDAAYALTLSGKILWLGSLVFLACQLVSWPMGVFAVLLVLAYPAFYDSHKVFSYGESFATPRLYAESFTLLAIGAWLAGRHVLAWTMVVLAGLFHPLMAMPGAALLFWMTAAERRWHHIVWSMLGLSAVLAVVILAFPDLRERIFSTYDSAWFDAIALRNPYVLLDRWSGAAFGRMLWIAVVLGLVAHQQTGKLRRLALGVLLVTASLLVVSWFGASVWKNILLTQLQLWRALWLAQLVALMLLPLLVRRLWNSAYADRILAACLVAALLQDAWAMGLFALVGVALHELFKRAGASIDSHKLLWRSLPVLIFLPWLVMHFLDLRYWLLVNDFYLGKAGWRAFLADRVVLVAIGIASYCLLAQAGKSTVSVALGLSGAALLLALFAWSLGQGNMGTTGWDDVNAQLKQDIPPGSVVAGTVQGNVKFIWFGLERPSYASQVQTAGGLFNRDTALEGVRRLQAMEKAGFPFSSTEWSGRGKGTERVSIQSVAVLCTDSALDYVILDGGREGAKQYFHNGKPVLSLFACRDFRAGQGAPL